MILSDRDLRRLYPESPFVQAASIDLHVGEELRLWPYWVVRDPRLDQTSRWVRLDPDAEDGAWELCPNNRYLAATAERVKVLPHLAGVLCARSSWGRDGLAVIQGPAGFVDPGFEGHLVLELSVVGSRLLLRPGDRIAQLVLHELTSPAERPYAGRYQGQSGVVPSRSHLDGGAS